MTKLESVKEDFVRALTRLKEIVREAKTDIVRDSAILRFELTFDLAWKTIKACIEERHNATCVSPQSCFREAFRLGYIDYEEAWVEIAKERNRAVHTYKEELAEAVYAKIPEALALFQKLRGALEKTP